MTTPPEILRARFEKWLDSQPPLLHKDQWREDYAGFKAGDYASPSTQLAWLAYQAAHAEAGQDMGEVVGILQKLVDYPNETSVSDGERALWAKARLILARLKKGEL